MNALPNRMVTSYPLRPLPRSARQNQGLQSTFLRVMRSTEQLHQRCVQDSLTTHAQNVAWLSYRLALAAGFLDRELSTIQILQAGLLHDLGKHTLPPELLNKTGPLSEAERDQIMTHPTRAHGLLRSTSEVCETVLDAILHHHERYDGNGYPMMLSGTSIPLLARIVAIADVFDALISARPYHEALPRQQAAAYLLKERGHQFDPQLTTIFLEEVVNLT